MYDSTQWYIASFYLRSRIVKYSMLVLITPGVASGIFRQGADPSDEGLKYGFKVLCMPEISEKIVFHLPTWGLACSEGGYSLLALP